MPLDKIAKMKLYYYYCYIYRAYYYYYINGTRSTHNSSSRSIYYTQTHA